MGIESYNKPNFNYTPNQFKRENIDRKKTQEIPQVEGAGQTGDKGKEGESAEQRIKREEQARMALAELAELQERSYEPTPEGQANINSIRGQIDRRLQHRYAKQALDTLQETPPPNNQELKADLQKQMLGRLRG